MQDSSLKIALLRKLDPSKISTYTVYPIVCNDIFTFLRYALEMGWFE